jgi:hypothetical protein
VTGQAFLLRFCDADGKELARSSVTTHPGDMSWTVTRGFEQDFEDLFGKGWMDR